jgi:opacity protein-like surface antigen
MAPKMAAGNRMTRQILPKPISSGSRSGGLSVTGRGTVSCDDGTELEVEEYFGEGIPEGSSSATDSGYGYYLGLGAAHYVTEQFIVLFEISRFMQLDVFEGDTAYPFDLAINAFSLGVGYRF